MQACSIAQYKISLYLWLGDCDDVETRQNRRVSSNFVGVLENRYNIRTNLIFYLWIQGQCQYLEFDQLQLMLHSTCTESTQHIDSIPLRIVSVHQCFDDNPLYVMMMSGINNKMRMQFFLGNSSCESRYRLLGCGIPVDCTCSSVSDPWLNLESFTLYRSSCAHRPNTCSAPIDIFQQPENHPSTSLDA
jgi:hypothetical protein